MATLPFDPASLPVDGIAGEAAVPAERLTVDWLRARFAAPPPWSPEQVDEGRLHLDGARHAAVRASVLVPLVRREAGLTLLLTQRTAHLSKHAGQVSFPGGRAETSDTSVVDTALRETEEEVGLDRQHVEVLGTLPDYATGSGFLVTPVVALVQPPFTLQADPSEVADIFEVPLAFLMDGQHHQRIMAPASSGRHMFYAMPYQQFYIWGATAGMLRNLFHFWRA